MTGTRGSSGNKTTTRTTLARVVGGAGVVLVLSAGMVSCSSEPLPPKAALTVVNAPAEAASASAEADPTAAPAKPPVQTAAGAVVYDSFGNTDFYTTLSGDTAASVAESFGLSEAKLSEFNALQPGVPMTPGTRLRLIPAEGPMAGAMGAAVVDADGIPTSYVVEPEDSTQGISYRFGITSDQLAEANKVPYVHEVGNEYFLLAGRRIELQKKPVDSSSGTGTTIDNSFGEHIFYTSVVGDSLDSLGYKFRCTTEQLLRYNPSLTTSGPIPAGTKVRLMPGELPITGATGSFTADADGVPLTYTTAPGDTERQVAFRFRLADIVDLTSANLSLTQEGLTWYAYTDSWELVPGQTISLDRSQPIRK
jgi:LysM repeat protein